MKQLLAPLLGTPIHIEQHNDVGLTGWLINVQADYASMFTDDGRLVHYPFGHIKSVTANITEVPQSVEVPALTFPESFDELLTALWLQPLRIELGEGSRQGVLVHITDEAVCLVLSSTELIYYPVSQIVNLSPIYKLKETDGESTSPDGGGDSQESGGTTHGSTEKSQSHTSQGDSKSDTTSTANGGDSQGDSSAHHKTTMTAMARAETTANVEESCRRARQTGSSPARLTLFAGSSSRVSRRRTVIGGESFANDTASMSRSFSSGSRARSARAGVFRQPVCGKPSWVNPRVRVPSISGGAAATGG